MSRRVRLSLAFGFAVLLSASFPRLGVWWFSFAALLPLLFGIRLSQSRLEAFRFSYLGGFLFLMFSLNWVSHVTFAGLVVFALLDAIAFGVFGWLVKGLFVRHLDGVG